jgi:hypothetical protein
MKLSLFNQPIFNIIKKKKTNKAQMKFSTLIALFAVSAISEA